MNPHGDLSLVSETRTINRDVNGDLEPVRAV